MRPQDRPKDDDTCYGITLRLRRAALYVAFLCLAGQRKARQVPTSPNCHPQEADHDRTLPRVGLFVTCLVDLFRPSVGFAAIKLIEDTGCSVDVPMAQTCCGQPAYNSGDRADTRAIAENTIRAFEDYDYVVAPSGSCAGMLKKHYPGLFKGDPHWEARAERFRRQGA